MTWETAAGSGYQIFAAVRLRATPWLPLNMCTQLLIEPPVSPLSPEHQLCVPARVEYSTLASWLSCLPPAGMRAAIDVQGFPCNILGFGQIDDSIDDVLDAGNRAQRRQSFQKIVRIVLMQRSIDHAGRDRIETDALLRVFDRQVAGHGIEAAFGNHRHRNIQARDRILDQ